jgi:hypothetical protein
MSFHTDEVPATSTLASTSNPLEPVMPLPEATCWLRELFTRQPAYIPGDNLGTCFSSYAAVVLSAIAVGADSPVILAPVTSYPAPFVAAVCNSMRRHNLWTIENVAALKSLLKKTPTDWTELQVGLCDAMECIWDVVWTPEAYIALESLRQGVLFGGEAQRWLDQDALELFQLT